MLFAEKHRELLVEWKKEQAEKALSEESGTPVSEVMAKWLKNVGTYRSKETVKVYQVSVGHYLKSAGDHAIEKYNKEYNRKFLVFLQGLKTVKGNPYTDTTIRRHIHQIQIFYNRAYREEEIDKQVKLQKPSLPKKDPVIFDTGDLSQLSKYIEERYRQEKHPTRKRNLKNHLRALYMATYTIMRRGAIWALKLENIDLEKRIIKIRHNPELNWKNKKNKEPNKPISDQLFQFLLEDLRDRSSEERYYLDNGKGMPCYHDPRQLTKAFSWHCKALGFPDGVKPLHGIRATGITELLASGVDIRTVKDLADHESIATTDGYVNSKKVRLKGAVENIEINL